MAITGMDLYVYISLSDDFSLITKIFEMGDAVAHRRLTGSLSLPTTEDLFSKVRIIHGALFPW